MIKRRAAWLVLLGSSITVAVILLTLLNIAVNPRPLRHEITRGESTIHLWTDNATLGFEGDCLRLFWDIRAIWAVYLNERDIPGTGDHYPCVFADQQPTFNVQFPSAEWESFTFPIQFLYPALVRPLLVLVALLAGLAALYLMSAEQRLWWINGRRQYLTALGLSVLLVAAVDVLTNSLDIYKLRWDHVYYISLAVEGYTPDNPFFAAPFIYRYSPLLARWLMDIFGWSFPLAFTAIAYLGTIGQLWGTFWLAKALGANFRLALIAVCVVAFSFFNTKFLIFDVYRPDPLAFALMTFALVALLKRQWALSLIFTSIGMLFREFAILLYLMLGIALLLEIGRTRRYVLVGWLLLIGIAAAATYIIPRQLLTSTTTYQVVTSENWQGTLLQLLSNENRNLNLFIIITSYCLPLLLLSTAKRWRNAWAGIRPLGWLLLGYTAGFAVLMLIGGGDTNRYMAFFVLVQVPLLVLLLQANTVSAWEIAYVLGAMLLLNRTFLLIPVTNPDVYLEFLVAFSDSRFPSTTAHLIEPFAYWGGLCLLRIGNTLWQQRKGN